jgi:hypothetical protein
MTEMSFWAQLDFDGLRTMDEIAPVYWACWNYMSSLKCSTVLKIGIG